jgi:hypothetical protein
MKAAIGTAEPRERRSLPIPTEINLEERNARRAASDRAE